MECTRSAVRGVATTSTPSKRRNEPYTPTILPSAGILALAQLLGCERFYSAGKFAYTQDAFRSFPFWPQFSLAGDKPKLNNALPQCTSTISARTSTLAIDV